MMMASNVRFIIATAFNHKAPRVVKSNAGLRLPKKARAKRWKKKR